MFSGLIIVAETFSEDEHAKLTLDVPPGVSHCHLRFEGGISIILVPNELHVGDASTGLKPTNLHLQGRTLLLEADVHPQGNATFKLRTPWKILEHHGASVLALPDSEYEITMESGNTPTNTVGYRHTQATLTFAPE